MSDFAHWFQEWKLWSLCLYSKCFYLPSPQPPQISNWYLFYISKQLTCIAFQPLVCPTRISHVLQKSSSQERNPLTMFQFTPDHTNHKFLVMVQIGQVPILCLISCCKEQGLREHDILRRTTVRAEPHRWECIWGRAQICSGRNSSWPNRKQRIKWLNFPAPSLYRYMFKYI